MTLCRVTIDGVDVSAYVISYDAEDSIEDVIDIASILFDGRIVGVIQNFYGKTVTIQEGLVSSTDRFIFRGTVRGYINKTVTVELECANKLQQLEDREATVSFDNDINEEAGVISEIAKTLIVDYGGLTADDSSVEDSGTTYIQRRFICNNDKVFERVNALKDLLSYQLYYKASDDKVYFESIGRTTNSAVLRFDVSGTTNILEIPKYDRDIRGIVTRVTVNGAVQLMTYPETFTATAGQTVFDLTYTPEETKVTVNGTIKVRYQLDGPNAEGDYYADPVNDRIVFKNALSGGETVIIEYSTLRPTPVQSVNEDAESLYLDSTDDDERFVEQTFSFTDIQSVEDARLRADAILDRLSQPLTNVICRASKGVGAIYPGERIRFIDTVNNIDSYFIVRSVNRKYPEPYDEISLGDDRLFKAPTPVEIQERIAKLEKEALQNTGVLIQSRNGNKTISVDLMQTDLYSRTTKALIWSDTIGAGNYQWSSSPTPYTWNNDAFNAQVLSRRIWPGDTFWHDGVDDNLIDTANTDATLDYTNQEIRAE